MDNEAAQAASTKMGQPSAQTTAPQYSHAGHGQQSLGHSVVPDLMKIYESLTQSKTPQTQHQEPQYQQQPPPPPPSQVSQPMYHNTFYPSAPVAAPFPYHPQQFNVAAQPPPGMPAPQYAPSEHEDTKPVATSSSGRTLRKRTVDKVEEDRSSSDGSTSRSRKKKKSDGRWSKRFTWPEELHRDFVSAIFDVGLKHSSPSALLEHMPEHDQISSERVKSRLQKYRLHRAKSKKEFMSCYEASLNNYQAIGIKTQSLGSGEVAAHLAYSVMTEPEEPTPSAPIPSQSDALQDSAHEMTGTSRGGALVLPKLTEAEKRSPLGASMGYMMGLFFALRQQLMANRAAAASGGADAAAAAPLNAQVPFVSYPNSTETEVGDHDGQLHDQNVASWPASSGRAMDTSQQQQHSSYQDQSNVAVAPNPQANASRTNLEESNLMKREMQSQMAFQNKMRALKQQELNKTKTTKSEAGHHHGHVADGNGDAAPQADDRSRIKQHDEEAAMKDGNEDDHGTFHEGGETAEAGSGHSPGGSAKARKRELSMGASEEFWVNDEQLFEFLMNN